MESDSPVVYCGYQIAAGARDEDALSHGLAHFVEHVTFKGTERRRAFNILNCMERVGGDLEAYTTKEETVFYAATLSQHVPRAIDVLSDIVFHSVYPQREIDKEVEVICDEISSYEDSPSELIFDDFENIIFQGHPLGHNILGEAGGVRAFKTKDALRFAREHYRPGRAIFFAYGHVNAKQIRRLLEKATTGFPAAEPSFRVPDAEEKLPQQIPTRIERDRQTHQAHVVVGCRTGEMKPQDRLALSLLNNILGGPGMNARLNIALRERRGLVYTVESSFVRYGQTGIWTTYFGCDQHDVERCLRLLRGELNRLLDTALTPQQLHLAKQQWKGQIGVACDNRESFALDSGKQFLRYGRVKPLPELFADIDALTADHLQRVAREQLSPDLMTTLIYK